jgi:hypothetical protein
MPDMHYHHARHLNPKSIGQLIHGKQLLAKEYTFTLLRNLQDFTVNCGRPFHSAFCILKRLQCVIMRPNLRLIGFLFHLQAHFLF